MKFLAMFLLALGLVAVSESAEAQEFTEFLFCDNCSTAAQFESVAKTRPTRRGEWNYAVGNRVTGKMMFVYVSYTPPGEVRLSVDDPVGMEMESQAVIIEVPIESPYVVAVENNTNAVINENPATWAITTSATTAQNEQFAAIVHVSSNRLIVNAPHNSYGFDSLAGAQMELVSPYLFNAMTTNNPAWVGNAIMGALKTVLYRAIGWTQGKGPIACLAFNNSDFACFQLNPADKNAAMYVEGTGKDDDENPINTSPWLPNGGGISTRVSPGIQPGVTGFGLRGSQAWLFCATQGGMLLSCWVEYYAQ